MNENPYESDVEPTAECTQDAIQEAAAHWAPQSELRIPQGMGQGLVNHVPLLASLMVLQGVAEVGYALFLAAVTITLPPNGLRGDFGRATVGWEEQWLFAAMSLSLLAIGSLTGCAGLAVRRYRGHLWGLLALSLGWLAFLGGYLCFPTAVLLSGYGLLVLSNASVRFAFRLGEQGFSPQQIRSGFAK